MNGNTFFRYFMEKFGGQADSRIVLGPQPLYIAVDRPALSWGNQDTIVVLYSGGTIGSELTPEGYAPADIRNLEDFISLHPELEARYELLKKTYPNTKFVFERIDPLDSGAMNDADRLKIIAKISELSKKYGTQILSFVLLHGTDSAVETACMMNNFFGDGSIPMLVVSSQFSPGRLGADGPVNFLDAIVMSHCNISGVHLIAQRKAFHPGDCAKTSDSAPEIFGDLGYGFGTVGAVFDGGFNIRFPFTARGYDPVYLPYVPERVIELCQELDTKGRFLSVANTLTTYDVLAHLKNIENGQRDIDAVFIEARGATSVSVEGQKVAQAAAIRGAAAFVGSVVPRATGEIHYKAAERIKSCRNIKGSRRFFYS